MSWIFVVTACSLSEMAATILPDEVEAQMEEIIGAITRHDLDTIKANGSDAFNAVDNLDEGINKIFQYIFTGEAGETKLINAKVNYKSSLGNFPATYYTGQFERTYPEGSNLYTIILVKKTTRHVANYKILM